MIIHHIRENNSILNKFIAEIRDASIQKDSLRFRRNIERIGEVLGYELSKFVRYNNKSIITPLGIKNIPLPANKIVICSILRAGLPLHQGLLNYFDDSENAFISAYRYHPNQDNNFEIKVEYFAAPSLKGKTLLLADPMLATGQSLVAVYEAIKKQRVINDIHIVAIIASTEGINFIKSHFPEQTHLWVAAIDDELDSKGYIVPGLGDAGDLAFGSKL
ncbi:MAG: uracil phosphoribosyltransferase [Flavobacteriaceae bacterium]|nr:uracil phosphoribosyltransferase [Flavobacteriaceae bacterium]